MFDPQQFVSERAKGIDASGIRRVFDLAAKIENPINLSIGQPDFDVPEPIKGAAIDAINAGPNGYTQTQGIAPLRESVLADFDARFQCNGLWNDRAALVTSGVSGGLVLALLACTGPGDEVLIPDPYFVMYKHLATLAGATAVPVDTYPDFRMTAQRVEPLITERTKLLIVSSPSNPTGAVLSEAEFAELAKLCAARNVLLVSDEIYDVFCYDPGSDGRCPSPASTSESVLVLRGYSKTYGMTGWRLGYAIGPSAIVEQMAKLQQYTFVCAPSMVQAAGLAAHEVDMSAYVDAYKKKRDYVAERLADTFDAVVPGGAFYFFPPAAGGLTGTEFVERAIEHDVLIIPGSVFSDRDTHFRLSYAADDETLKRGLDVLCEIAGG